MAGRYATGLFDLARETNAIDAVKADLERFDALIAESADLNRLVRSPVFSADEQSQALSAELDAERQRAAQLASELAALRKALTAERSSRVVDQSHHVDDFETLRTRVLRQLSAQADLLADSLHALRHGSTDIAEEFVDRSLTAITKEVTQLKEMDKYRQ